MPEGSEFQTEGGSDAETAGSKGCVDTRDRQQIGVGGAYAVENVPGCGSCRAPSCPEIPEISQLS